jgi:hypothetical protein
LTTTIFPTATQTVTACNPNSTDLSQSCVYLRVEGADNTIFEGYIVSGPVNVTTPSGGTHLCDGTNNGANAIPGGTCTSALNEASIEAGFPFDGTFDSQVDDLFITSISDSTETSTEFWALLLNYQFTPGSGCQQEASEGAVVLWAFNAFDLVDFLRASTSSTVSSPDTASVPVAIVAGTPFTIFVTNGSDGTPVSGAAIAGQTTDANGEATLIIADPGTYQFKATKAGSLRSNFVNVIVVAASIGQR